VAVGVWLVSGVVSSTIRLMPTRAPTRAASGEALLAPLVVPQVETAPTDDETTPPAPQVGARKSGRAGGHHGTQLTRALSGATIAGAAPESVGHYAVAVLSAAYRRGFHQAAKSMAQAAEQLPQDALFEHLLVIGRTQRGPPNDCTQPRPCCAVLHTTVRPAPRRAPRRPPTTARSAPATPPRPRASASSSPPGGLCNKA